jgi:DNA-binding transcriptional ArsR family regulator
MTSAYYTFFSKLSSPLRIKIISHLEKGEKSVKKLSEDLSVEQSKLSHALKELRECNIVSFRKEGKQRIYCLSDTIIPILKLIENHGKTYCKKCGACNKK